jgi:hypothetical protein
MPDVIPVLVRVSMWDVVCLGAGVVSNAQLA